MNVIEECKKNNFNVIDDNGVVILLMKREDYFTKSRFIKETRKFRMFLKSIGYRRSYGYRPIREDAENTDD